MLIEGKRYSDIAHFGGDEMFSHSLDQKPPFGMSHTNGGQMQGCRTLAYGTLPWTIAWISSTGL